MKRVRRTIAVAGIRAREAARGPLTALAILYLLVVAGIAAVTPGEAGLDRQSTIDRWTLDAALIAAVVAAAVFGASSLASDRESGREAVLRATSLRRSELLLGGFLGHFAVLALLLLFLGSAAIAGTGWLSGGDRDRRPTRVALRAETLLDSDGRPVLRTRLSKGRPEATFVLDAPRARTAPGDEVRAWVQVREFVEQLEGGIPAVYPVAVRADDGTERVLQLRTGNPLRIRLPRESIREQGGTRLEIRRLNPVIGLGLDSGGLIVEGRPRPFLANVAKAVLAWLLAAGIVLAAATALSAFVAAPIAAAGSLLLVLAGRSIELLRETAQHAEESETATAAVGHRLLEGLLLVLPNLDDFDLVRPVVLRWDIPTSMLLEPLPRAVLSISVLLALTGFALAIRRPA